MSVFHPIKARGVWHCVIIDSEDVGLLDYNWHLDSYGYAIRHSRGEKPRRTIQMHREVLGLQHRGEVEVDHINRFRLDNRRANLRLTNRRGNCQNVGVRSDNTSGFRGVQRHSDGKKWQATVRTGGKQIYLGLFNTPEEAAAVSAAKRAEFGYLGANRTGATS